jgi:hypothetical protein
MSAILVPFVHDTLFRARRPSVLSAEQRRLLKQAIISRRRPVAESQNLRPSNRSLTLIELGNRLTNERTAELHLLFNLLHN